jgi:hypothetical protein
MSSRKSIKHFLLVTIVALLLGPAMVQAQAEDDTAAERQKMKELGLQYKTAWDLFSALKEREKGGKPLTWQNTPDWGGVYARTKGGTAFDPDGPPQGEPPSAKFTPKYHAQMMETVEGRKKGVEYDPLSQCIPPTYPRWLDMPFLREHIVTPKQTVIVTEAFNAVRFIYTDGRDHIPEADRYPTESGDAIGFWSNGKLYVHTNQIMGHMYERAQGFYSDEAETVESEQVARSSRTVWVTTASAPGDLVYAAGYTSSGPGFQSPSPLGLKGEQRCDRNRRRGHGSVISIH